MRFWPIRINHEITMEITRAASPTALAQPYAAPAKSLAIN